MPMYTFSRPDGTTLSHRLTFAEYEQVKSGEMKVVDEEGQDLTLVFDPGKIGFVMKDGASGGWVSKALKEHRYRQARSQEMARRENDHVFKSRLVPNYEGKEAHNWSDVQDHVRSTKGDTAAQTYDRLVSKEKLV